MRIILLVLASILLIMGCENPVSPGSGDEDEVKIAISIRNSASANTTYVSVYLYLITASKTEKIKSASVDIEGYTINYSSSSEKYYREISSKFTAGQTIDCTIDAEGETYTASLVVPATSNILPAVGTNIDESADLDVSWDLASDITSMSVAVDSWNTASGDPHWSGDLAGSTRSYTIPANTFSTATNKTIRLSFYEELDLTTLYPDLSEDSGITIEDEVRITGLD